MVLNSCLRGVILAVWRESTMLSPCSSARRPSTATLPLSGQNVREDGRTKQRIIRNLGRKEAVLASGALDRLVASIGRFAEAPWSCAPSRRAIRAQGAPDRRAFAVRAALGGDRVPGGPVPPFDRARLRLRCQRAVFVAVLHHAGLGPVRTLDGLRHPRRRGADASPLLPGHGLRRSSRAIWRRAVSRI